MRFPLDRPATSMASAVTRTSSPAKASSPTRNWIRRGAPFVVIFDATAPPLSSTVNSRREPWYVALSSIVAREPLGRGPSAGCIRVNEMEGGSAGSQ